MENEQLADLRARADAHPADVGAQIEAAYACDRYGEERDAIGYYDAAWKLGVPDAERRKFLVGYGSTLRNVGRIAESIERLQAAVVELPEVAAVPAFLALSLHSAGRHEEAMVAALDAVLHPGPLDGYERALRFYRDEIARVSARVELHYGAQILAACADAWLPHRDDDGHTAMQWRDGSLVGETGLSLRCRELALVSPRGNELALRGVRLADAIAWADAELGAPRGAKIRDYDLPARHDGPFAASSEELAQLAAWFDRGTATLRSATRTETLRSPILVWPHHFDLGAILGDGIGLGLSLGDKYYAEPYYYVTPAAPLATTPRIAGWRTELWQGAVLTASQHGDADAFMASAIAAIRG